jgi:hypothetical protein
MSESSLKEKAYMSQCPLCKGFGTLPHISSPRCWFCDGHGRLEMVRLKDAERENLILDLKNKADYALAEARARKLEKLKRELQQILEDFGDIQDYDNDDVIKLHKALVELVKEKEAKA